jgi:hypothetical protein
MAPSDDDKKTEGKDDGPKRPTPTIELEAEVVDQNAAAEPDTDGKSDKNDSETDKRTSEKPTAKPDAQNNSGQAKSGGRGVVALMSHMAAGLLGGLIGAAALAYGLGALPFGPQNAVTPLTGDTKKDVEAMRGQIDLLKSGSANSLKSLQDRLAKIEKTLAARGDEDGKLTARLDKLEAAGVAVSDKGAGEASANAEFKSDLAALKSETETLRAQGEQLTKDLEKIGSATGQAGAPGVDAAALSAMSSRVNDLEKQLGSLAGRQQTTSNDAQLAALAVALASLEQAADRGAAYSDELDTLKSLTPAGSNMARADLKALEAGALTGVQSQAQLVQSFARYRRAALDAAVAPKSDALIDQITSRARSLVRVRPSGPQEGDGTVAVLSRVEGQLKDGNLAKAVEEAASLKGKVASAIDPWISTANARLSVDRELANLRREMLGKIATIKPEGDG